MIMELDIGILLLTVERWGFREFCSSRVEVVASVVVLSF